MAADLDKLLKARAAAAADGNADAVKMIDERIYKAQNIDTRSYSDRLLEAAGRARKDGNQEALAKIHEKMVQENTKQIDAAKQAEADKLGPFARAAATFGGGIVHGINQAGNLLSNGKLVGSTDEDVKSETQDLNRLTKDHPGTGSVPRFLGGLIPSLATFRAGPQTAGQLLRGAATQGGVFADPGERGQGVIMGTATAGALKGAGKLTSTLARPIKPTGAGKVLWDQGYADELTAGQLNPGGFLNRLEHATANVPIAGPIMRKAYDKSLGILDNRLEAEMTPNLGQVTGRTSPASGVPIPAGDTHKFLKTALDRLDKDYDAVRQMAPGQGLGPIPWTPANTVTMADNIVDWGNHAFMDPGGAKKLIHKALTPVHKTPTWSALHEARSNVREMARKIGPNAGREDTALRDALREVNDELTKEMTKHLPQQGADLLAATDKSWNYGHMVADASAAGSGLKTAKTFQPNALAQAKEARLGTVGTATGAGGPQREFIEAADAALTPPPSAEAARAIQAAGGGPFALAALRKRALGVVGGLSGAYTPWGQNFLKGQAFWQPALRATQAGVPDETQALIRLLAVQKENE